MRTIDGLQLLAPVHSCACKTSEDYVVYRIDNFQLVETQSLLYKAEKAAEILNSHEISRGRVKLYDAAYSPCRR
jgi:hypothetical protein